MPSKIEILRNRKCDQHKRRKAKWIVFTNICMAFHCCDECKKEWEKGNNPKLKIAIESIDDMIKLQQKKYTEKI